MRPLIVGMLFGLFFFSAPWAGNDEREVGPNFFLEWEETLAPGLNSAQSVQTFGNYLFVAYPDRLFRSNDGGLNWSFLDFSKKYNQLGRGIIRFFFSSPGQGWLGAENGIWETKDGGKFWEKEMETHVMAWRKQGNVIWMGTNNPAKAWQRKEDGKSWELCGDGPFVPYAVEFFGDSTGVGIAKERRHKGILVVTKDGGCNWKRKGIAVEGLFWAPSFASEEYGWLASPFAGGDLYFTRDGGKNWKSVPIPGKSLIFSVFSPSEDQAWILNTEGCFFQTLDGGQSWKPGIPDFKSFSEKKWPEGEIAAILTKGKECD